MSAELRVQLPRRVPAGPMIRRRRRVARPLRERFAASSPVLAWAMSSALALALSAVVLTWGPVLARDLEHLLFGGRTSELAAETTLALRIAFALFVGASFFPLVLSLGFLPWCRSRVGDGSPPPLVTVVLPAHDEEAHIERSVRAALALDYPSLEVIVVDDGSTDRTLPLAEAAPVTVIHLRHNQGKVRALNAALHRAKGEILVCSDGDSWLHPDALRHLVRPFADPEVGAVAGRIVVHRPRSFLERCQMLEYAVGQAIVKDAQVGSGSSVAVCPGPVSAFRRSVLVEMGGFPARTITEDFDATLQLVSRGSRVAYAPRAVAFTQVPTTWRALGRQRLRWFRGNLQVLRAHASLPFSPVSGGLGRYWLPIHQFLCGHVGGLLELLVLPLLAVILLTSAHPVESLKAAIAYGVLIEGLGLGLALLALLRTPEASPSLLLAAPFVYPYRLFLNGIRLAATVREVRGKASTWSG